MGHKSRKGPLMPSHLNQNTGERTVKEWRTGVQSTRQRMRYLTVANREVLDSMDLEYIAVGALIRYATASEPNPQFAMLVMINAARELSDSTGETFPVIARKLVEDFTDARLKRLEDMKAVSVTYVGSIPEPSPEPDVNPEPEKETIRSLQSTN